MAHSLVETIVHDGRVLLLADAAAKATILLALAWLVARRWRRGSAAARHQVWAMALCGLIALPAVSWLAPGWRLPILREQAAVAEPAPLPASSMVVESSNPRPTPFVVPEIIARRETPPIRVAPSRAIGAEAAVYPVRVATVAIVAAPPRKAPSTWTWTATGAMLTVWLAGFLMVALPTALGVLSNEWRRRRAEPLTGGDWRTLLEGVRREFAIRRNIDLLRGEGWSIPATWGVGRPVVLLPEDADSWPEPTRRMVLLHELAHVRRLDAATQLAGRLACALFWFHPLAWHALSRLRIECEHACDDCVIEAGERPVAYARQLLDLALTIRSFRSSTALAMARPHTLEVRMKALFDAKRDHAPLNGRSAWRLAAVAAIVVIGVATAHPGRSAASAKPSPDEAAKPAAKGTGRIAGTALMADGGKTVGGAEIVLLDPPPKGQDVYYGKLPLRRVVADARGAFSFDGLAPGRYRVWANSGKLTSRKGSSRGEVVLLPEAGDGPKPVELRLSPVVTVTARVKDKATGKPIAGATVHLGWSDFLDDATTDKDGVALLQPLTKEKWLVEAWADNHAKSSQWLSLESGADAEAEFALEPGGDLSGIVRDPSGKPLADVGLSARAEGKHEELEYVTTDKDGRFRLRHLPRNLPLTVTASKKEYVSEPFPAQVDGGGEVVNVTLRPRPHGGSIAGVVVDARGNTIAGAELSNMGSSSSDIREAKTGPDGRFRLENLYESHLGGKEILVRAKGSAPKWMKVEPGPADKPAEVTIAMELGHRITGVVVDDKGRALDGVVVYFADANHANSAGGQSTTDKQGRFTFDALPPDCPFAFSKKGYSQIDDLKLALDGDEVARVEMIPSGVIAGKVVDAKTGKPVRAFNVRVTFSPKRQPGEPNGGLVATLSDPGQNYQSDEGKFRLGELVATMPLQVMIAADGYERHVAQRIVATRSDAAGTEEFALDPIDPATLRTYAGRLLDDKGKPIAGAQVRLIAARERNEKREEFPFGWQMITSGQIGQAAGVTRFLEASTDKLGKFAFAKIPKDDSVEIVWWRKGIPAGRADNLHLREDREKQAIDITVPASGRIIGTIDRKAFGDAGRVYVSPVNGTISLDQLELKPGQEDFEIGDLPAGEYHVSLMSPYERSPGRGDSLTSRPVATGKVTVDAGGTSRVEFR